MGTIVATKARGYWSKPGAPHLGRPGQRGGSLPREEGAAKGDMTVQLTNGLGAEALAQDYHLSQADLRRMCEGLPGRHEITARFVEGEQWEERLKRQRLELHGTSHDAQGNKVAEWHVDCYRGGKLAYWHWIAVGIEAQGGDIGKQIIRKTLAGLAAAGYNEVGLFADVSIGRYAWAKEGAEYQNGDAGGRTGRKLMEWMKQRHIPLLPDWPEPPDPPAGEAGQAAFEKWMDLRSERGDYWRQFWAGKGANDLARWQHPQGYKVRSDDLVPDEGYQFFAEPEFAIQKGLLLDIGKAFMLDPGQWGHGAWDAKIRLKRRRSKNWN